MALATPHVVIATNPRTGEPAGEYEATSDEQYERIVADAVRASTDPRLADATMRSTGLRRAASRMRALGDGIVDTAGRETGLPEPRLRGELERTCVQLEMFADVVESGEDLEPIIDLADVDARPVPRPDLRRYSVPLGPVAVFGASNFPLAFSTAGGDTASALAAGCPVIVKGHPAHPGTATAVAEVLSAGLLDAGLPRGTFAQVIGASNELGERLVDDPRIQAVAFTGSFRGGQAISRRAALRRRPIPVYAEMGSLNPLVVTRAAAGARGSQIARDLADSVANFGGQLCTKPGIVLVPNGAVGEQLIATLADGLADREPEVLLTRQVFEAYAAGLAALEATEGVVRLTPHKSVEHGFYAVPAVFRATSEHLAERPALLEEHFGPAIVALTYDVWGDIADALQTLGGQLTISIHSEAVDTDDVRELLGCVTRLCGRVVFDGYPTGVSVCWAMEHGGPFPASSDAGSTSVGMTALRRFVRPVVLQNAPEPLLPPAVADGNPLGITRRVNGALGAE